MLAVGVEGVCQLFQRPPQWLGLHASIVWGLGWILGQATKIPQGQKKAHCIPHHMGLFISKPARASVLLTLHISDFLFCHLLEKTFLNSYVMG